MITACRNRLFNALNPYSNFSLLNVALFLFVAKIFYFAIRMIIGEVVKRLRLTFGLTQEEVCRRASLTQGFYSSIENGATPSLETLIRLAEAFDLPVFSLLWLATEKRDIPKRHRAWYNTRKMDLDNIIEETTKQ